MLEDVHEAGLKLARVLAGAAQAHATVAERAARDRDEQRWRANIDVAFERATAAAALLERSDGYEPERTERHLAAVRIALRAGFYNRAEDLLAAARTGRSPDEYAGTIAELVFEIRREREKSESTGDTGRARA